MYDILDKKTTFNTNSNTSNYITTINVKDMQFCIIIVAYINQRMKPNPTPTFFEKKSFYFFPIKYLKFNKNRTIQFVLQ